jgi:GNAT superfamily N-acetyltransferase
VDTRRWAGNKSPMTDDLLIRPLEPEDFDDWLVLWDGYNEFYGRVGPTALPREVTETTWARFFNPEEPMHAFVAEYGGRLAGLAHYLFHRSTTAIAPICYLQDLFTSESLRGRGVGTRLIEAVAEAARAAGSPRVYWQTHETNATARRLYDEIAEHSGFLVYRITL